MRICVLLEKSGETVLLRPDEIASGDTIAETVNTKKTLKVALSPQMEAWGFAEHTRTYVTAIDLDRTTNRVIFRGRVSSVQKNMDASGRYTEDLICGSAVEYLDDSAQAYTYDSGYAISAVVGWIIQHHNSSVNAARQLKVGNISPAWSTCKNIAIGSHFEALRALVASDDLTQQNTNNRVRRWFHERYEADGTYIDILDYDSIQNDTALLIGDNIKNLKYERGLESKIVTHLTVVSGLSVEGYTYQYTAVDSAAYQLYGRHEVVIHDTSIYSNEPHYVEVFIDDAWRAVVSDSYDAMMAALAARAETELDKYKTPYTKITLDADDLAAIGISGYARFAVGQRLPVICPMLDIVEDEMLITSIRRNLASGQIVSLTLERGEPPSGTISGSLALRMAQLKEANDRAQQKRDEEEADKLNAKFEQELDGYGMKEFTTESYDALPDDSPYKMGTSKTVCMVKDEGTGKTAMYVAGQHIDEGGGGGGSAEGYITNNLGSWVYAVATTESRILLFATSAPPYINMAEDVAAYNLSYYTPEDNGATLHEIKTKKVSGTSDSYDITVIGKDGKTGTVRVQSSDQRPDVFLCAAYVKATYDSGILGGIAIGLRRYMILYNGGSTTIQPIQVHADDDYWNYLIDYRAYLKTTLEP